MANPAGKVNVWPFKRIVDLGLACGSSVVAETINKARAHEQRTNPGIAVLRRSKERMVSATADEKCTIETVDRYRKLRPIGFAMTKKRDSAA
jgi:hypothetical protein